MGKHKYSRIMCFLNISREAVTYTIPRTWEKWILIKGATYGKTQALQSYGFLIHISCEALIHTILKIKDKGKNMGKHKHVKVFLNFPLEAKTHALSKTWKKWISIVREKYGKTQTFQIYGFLQYFWSSGNPQISKIWETWILAIREEYGKKQTFQSCRFLKHFGWSRSPYMRKVNLLSTGKVWEHILRYLAD